MTIDVHFHVDLSAVRKCAMSSALSMLRFAPRHLRYVSTAYTSVACPLRVMGEESPKRDGLRPPGQESWQPREGP
jgi:hypothetical protein